MTKQDLINLIVDADVTGDKKAQSDAIDLYFNFQSQKPEMTPPQKTIIETCLFEAVKKAKLGSLIYSKETVDFAIKYFEDQIPKKDTKFTDIKF